MSGNQVLLFLIVGKNEPLYEAEIHKRGGTGNSDAVARQNYFVVHSALDLVEKASWTTQNMYLKVVDKVRNKKKYKKREEKKINTRTYTRYNNKNISHTHTFLFLFFL